MSLITDRCKTISGLIKFAKEVKETVTTAGETFYFAPVGCDEDQVDALSAKGFKLFRNADGREGLCWSKGRH